MLQGSPASRIAPLPKPPTGSPGFRVVLADPPWSYANAGVNGDPTSRYSTLTTAEICALPVASVTARTSALFLWVPASHLPEALQVMESWSFRYRTAIPWIKTRRTDGEVSHGGLGRPWRSVHELLLYGLRGSARTSETQTGMLETLDTGEVIQAPRGHHSQKPLGQYGLIERAYPSGPYVELFGRRPREGWTVWGNEVDHDIPESITRSKRAFKELDPASPERHPHLPVLRPYERPTPEQRAEMNRALARQYRRGASLATLGAATGYSVKRIRSALLAEGVELRKRSGL